MMRSICKPPLARSPIRLRSRRVAPPPSTTALHIPPGSLTKSQKPKRVMDNEELDLRPEIQTISCELWALARMVQQEFGKADAEDVRFGNSLSAQRSPLFERGRFYDEYAARRNERLRRKKGKAGEEKKPVYDLGVRVESVKRRGEPKKYESSARKAVPSTPMTERRAEASTPRYLLRSMSSKENKKPSLATPSSATTAVGGRKTTARRVRKI